MGKGTDARPSLPYQPPARPPRGGGRGARGGGGAWPGATAMEGATSAVIATTPDGASVAPKSTLTTAECRYDVASGVSIVTTGFTVSPKSSRPSIAGAM